MNGSRPRRTGAARLGAALFLAVVYLTQSGYDGCSGDILADSGFDIWCGDELCSWKVEEGAAKKAPTWHRADLGVDLIGDGVVLSQRSDVSDGDAPCVRFELVADIAEDASVTLAMDLFGDGEVDWERQLPTSAWAPLVYVVHMPLRYQGIVFRLGKTGGGRAVLAQIRARSLPLEECDGAMEIEALPVPLGGACSSRDPDDPLASVDDACESGECSAGRSRFFFPFVCGECEDDAGCGEGEVCGLVQTAPSFLDPYRACVPAASRALGQLCAGDGDCSTGVCCGGLCSTCCTDDERGCEGDRSCYAPIRDDAASAPQQCDPGERRGPPGSACLADDDCESGACTGGEPLRVCELDGRACAEDPDCPEGEADPLGQTFGHCVLLGTAGGSCD